MILGDDDDDLMAGFGTNVACFVCIRRLLRVGGAIDPQHISRNHEM